MACKKCGGNHSLIHQDFQRFSVHSSGEETLSIGAKASIWLEDDLHNQTLLRVGKVIKINKAAAIDLQTQGAPIWIVT